ncbi:PREDICTED: uncharacterized protein LOC108365650 [Rhagoletis zephyria]|uniref:uncharacterized protein LOC108365650 n=1 Tax=Rhagoletis zephyria TaxID=28612 RepID=UPI0008112563|nr:PREDICTED: uncharacterized protein LOC108365650 [Rhagoletis zephyria]
MDRFEDLGRQQRETGGNIESIVRNFKKDPQSWKQSISYYEERLRRLDSEWSKFETTDNKLRLRENPQLDHDYFTKDYYNNIMEIVNQYKEIFESAVLQLAQTPTRELRLPTNEGSTYQHDASASKVNTEARHDTGTKQAASNEYTKLVRRQGVMMASLRRLLNDNVSPQCVPTINKLWENIEDIHFRIYEMFDNPTEQGYKVDNFISLEEKVWSTLQAANSDSHTEQSSNQLPIKLQSISLPKIIIPKFDGTYLKWQEFHDLFSQLVINQPLSKVQKMWYLKTHLVGEAGNLIKHFASTGENFDAAWFMLLERYNNKRLLVSKLVHELTTTPGSTSMDNVKKLHDTTQECLLALQNLQIDTSTWDPLLLPLLLKKLDQPTRLRYEQSLSKPREVQTLKEFLQFLEKHFQSMEAMGVKDKSTSSTAKVCTSVTSKGHRNDTCSMCKKGKHPLFSCKEFLQQSPSARFQFIQGQKYCHNCLKPGHGSKNCILRNCLKCNKKHNTLLHFEDSKRDVSKDITSVATPTQGNESQSTTPSRTKSTPSKDEAASLTTAKHTKSNTYVLLSTAMVKVRGIGTEVQCRAILDSGSQVNFVTERLVKRLGISTKPSSISISGIGSRSTKIQHRVNVALQSRINNFTTRLEAAVLPQIISPQPSQEIKIDEWQIPENIMLADPSFNRPDKIDILLGAEFYNQLMAAGQIKLSDDLPILQNTVLGWIIAGKVGGNYISNAICGICTNDDINLDAAIARLWELEDVATVRKQHSVAEKHCEAHFAQHTLINENGRFMVRLPFHENPEALGESYGMAYNRFLALERRLAKSLQTKNQYVQFMEEYENLGHMTQVDIDSISKPRYFIPHHCIVRPESRTTKLRVVFDASAKSSTGMSLNDLMYTGPTVQSELFTILLRFRLPRFVFTTDVEKMYRQMLIQPDERKFQLIIWRKDSSLPIKHYQLNTITYGTRSAPYLATKCLQKIAKENALQYPLGAQFLQDNFYVDDGIGGSDSLTTTMEIQQQLIHILKQRGLNLRKWCANHSQLLQNVSREEQEVDIDFDNDINQTIKTLGLTWMPKMDRFCVKVCLGSCSLATKRSVSADLARLFDPLGLLAPIVVMAKMFIQDLWQLKLTWDEALPADLNERWTTFRNDLQKLDNLQVSRHVFEGYIPAKIQIHVFSDASEKAYGAAIYIRSELDEGRVQVRLLCAKSRVAPSKRQTVPRLELCTSVLGAQLTTRVKSDLKLDDVATYFWTDSQIVLAWINSSSASYQTFVANRIAVIHEHTTAEQWRHISSKDNPADILSRGLPPGRLETCNMWFYGPTILFGKEDTWPSKYSKALSVIDEGINMEWKGVT